MLTSPVVTSVSPTLVLNTPTVSFTVNGSNLTGSTFSFLPAFSPAAITASNVNINGNGTSATMTLTLASNASGSFTAVATTSSGSSSQISSASNTLTVFSADPNADFDGDGLTNIYEAAIGTNYANFSTTNDGLPDGWALFYTSAAPLSAGLAGQTVTILGGSFSPEPPVSEAVSLSEKTPNIPMYERGDVLLSLGFIRMMQGRYTEAEEACGRGG